MTNEQLLQPRYEAIAGYPDSEFKIGEILDRDWCKYKNDDVETGKIIWKISDFPHLFRKLQWWEKRKPEEMPEYVREGTIVYPASWEIDDGELIMTSEGARWVATSNIMRHCQPATETEYLNYVNVKQ